MDTNKKPVIHRMFDDDLDEQDTVSNLPTIEEANKIINETIDMMREKENQLADAEKKKHKP